jgi:hypothetical protein
MMKLAYVVKNYLALLRTLEDNFTFMVVYLIICRFKLEIIISKLNRFDNPTEFGM